MGPLLALSWPNLPCALKAGIGIGNRTLAYPASLPRSGGGSKALGLSALAGPPCPAGPGSGSWDLSLRPCYPAYPNGMGGGR